MTKGKKSSTKDLPKSRGGQKFFLLAVDTETTGITPHHGSKPFLVSTCTPEGKLKCWEWKVDPITREPSISHKDRLAIKKYLEGKVLIFHHAKFDLRLFSTIGLYFSFQENSLNTFLPTDSSYKPLVIKCQGFHDTLLASHACSSKDNHGLKELGVKYLRYSDSDERSLKKEVLKAKHELERRGEVTLGTDPSGKRQVEADYWMVRAAFPENDCCLRYAERDVERTILLWKMFVGVMKDLDVRKGYERELALLPTVYRMETHGLTINRETLKKKLVTLTRKKRDYKVKAQSYIDKKLGKPSNLNSPKDLPALLHKTLRLPILATTDKGSPKTDKGTLGKLIEHTTGKGRFLNANTFLRNLLCNRVFDKGIGSLRLYDAHAISHPIHPWFGSLYYSLNQSGTDTTRFSASNPNSQNVSKIVTATVGGIEIPGPKLREIFGPIPGWTWYAIDYNQLELRIFAFLSQEKSLIKALADGHDFHSYVAERIFDKLIEEITAQERRIAKNTNFAIIFGASPWKVDMTAGMEGAYEMFAGLFPNVASYMKKRIATAKKDLSVRTLSGYRLDVPSQAPYKIVSYEVQGSAGDLIKEAMIEIDESSLVDWNDSRIVLQIHDELLIGFRSDSPQHTPKNVYNIMQAMERSGEKYGVLTPVSCDRIEHDWGHGEKVLVTPNSITAIPKKVA